jgi:flagellar biosynthesis/type III secretory pathway protein FliH
MVHEGVIEKALSEAARKALDMEPQIKQFFSEAHQRSYAKGKAEGEAKGEAKAVMMILQQRGLVPTDEQQRQILSCTDVAILDRWLARALSVASVDELLA